MPERIDVFERRPVFEPEGMIRPSDVRLSDKKAVYGKIADDYFEYRDSYWNLDFLKDFNLCIEHARQTISKCESDKDGKYILDSTLIDKLKTDLDNAVTVLKDIEELKDGLDFSDIGWPEDVSALIELIMAVLFSGHKDAIDVALSFVYDIKGIKCADIRKRILIIELACAVSRVGDYSLFFDGKIESAMTFYWFVVGLGVSREWLRTENADEQDEEVKRYSLKYSDEFSYLEEVTYAFWDFSLVHRAIRGKAGICERKYRKNGKTHVATRSLNKHIYSGTLVSEINIEYLQGFFRNNWDLRNIETYKEDIESLWSGMWAQISLYYGNLVDMDHNNLTCESLRRDLGVFYILLNERVDYGLYHRWDLIDKKRFVEQYSELDLFSGFELWKYQSIDEFIEKECDGNDEAFDLMLYIIINVKLIKELLGVGCVPDDLAYYTSLSTLEYLLPISAGEPKYGLKAMKKGKMTAKTVSSYLEPEDIISSMIGRYSIMNVGHMNDPQEGKTLLLYLLGHDLRPDKTDKLTNPYVFVKSFTTRIDDIPMWEMYGEKAKGCCVVLDGKRINKEGKYDLHRVCYLRQKKDKKTKKITWTIEAKDNSELYVSTESIEGFLKNLQDTCRRYMLTDPKNAQDKILAYLDPILYLFKSATYSHENEFRIIENTDRNDNRICFTKESDGGRIYIPSKQRTYIKELILGPKCKAVEDKLPYLQYRCQYLEDELDLKITIKASSDEYI